MKLLLGRAGAVQERRQSGLKSCCKVEGNDLFSTNRINGFGVKEGEPLTIPNEVRAVMNCLERLWGLGQEGGPRLDITSSDRTWTELNLLGEG